MGEHEMSVEKRSWWVRLRTMEPAMLRGIVGAVVVALGYWGVNVSDVADKISNSYAALFPVVILVISWWTRSVVYSPASVDKIKEEIHGE